jgi:leucyl/phenylalanyl-tRNA--protein transferase
MPVFKLTEQLRFPDPLLAETDGLLAIGGDLSPQRLLFAYSLGIFPWYSSGDPILWWFTSPRLVIFPEEFRIPKRLARLARNSTIRITRDRAFQEVILACRKTRIEKGEKTWILPEIGEAFTRLHEMGFAHSVECWQDEKLVGGLYGISMDKVFFGESMFSIVRSASQLALISLVEHLLQQDYKLIDCQMTTQHLLRFGAREISGRYFKKILNENINTINPHEDWKN